MKRWIVVAVLFAAGNVRADGLAAGTRQSGLKACPRLAQRGFRLGGLELLVGHEMNGMHQLPRALVERQQIGRPVPGVARLGGLQGEYDARHGDRAAQQTKRARRRRPDDTSRAECKPGLVGKGTDEVEKLHAPRPGDYCRTAQPDR